MLNKLTGWLRRQNTSPSTPDISITPQGIEEEIPRYPPFVKGLPMCPPERLMETQKELLSQIRETLGLTKAEHAEFITPLVANCAAFIHLLPASEAHHHRGAGGLFRHSLEVGLFAARFAEGKIFAFNNSPEERKEEEPRWVVAAFTAALLHDIGKAATDMAVTDATGKVDWAPYMETLWDWGVKNNVDRYFVRWHENRHKNHEQTGVLLANQVLPLALKGWLAKRNPNIIRTMLEASTCRGDHVLTSLVERADSASVERDLRVNRTVGTEMSVGVPVERHLLDASRRLISDKRWLVNENGARVWVTEAGVFIVWKPAAEEIVDLLRRDNVPGIPRNHDTLADLLLERDIAVINDEENADYVKRYWQLSPSKLELRKRADERVWLHCLKLQDPQLLFSSEPPSPVEALLKGPDGEEFLLEGIQPTGEVAPPRKATMAMSSPAPDDNAPQVALSETDSGTLPTEDITPRHDASLEREKKARECGVKLAKPGHEPPGSVPASPPSPSSEAAPISPSDQPKQTSPQPEGAPQTSAAPQHHTSSKTPREDQSRKAAKNATPPVGQSSAPEKARGVDMAAGIPAQPEVDDTSHQASNAEAWLSETNTDASALLMKVIGDIRNGVWKASHFFGEENGVLYLRYPDPLRPYAKPADITASMMAAGWIVPDPETPARKAREMQDGKGLVFTTDITERLLPIVRMLKSGALPVTPKATPQKPKSESGKGAAPAPASANKAKTKPKSYRKHKQTPKNEKEAGPSTTSPSMVTQDAPAPASDASLPVAPVVPAVTNDDGRPPLPTFALDKSLQQIVDKFVKDADAGRIKQAQLREPVSEEGEVYTCYSLSALAEFASEKHPSNAIRKALDTHPRITVRADAILMKDK